jgi:hypothetical protein
VDPLLPGNLTISRHLLGGITPSSILLTSRSISATAFSDWFPKIHFRHRRQQSSSGERRRLKCDFEGTRSYFRQAGVSHGRPFLLTLAVIVGGIGEWPARAAPRIAARLRGQL